jgi:hypothetical protein
LRNIYLYLLFLSIGINVYLLIQKINNNHKREKLKELSFTSDNTLQQGYNFLKKKVNEDFPEVNLEAKTTLFYFWDSLAYDDIHRIAMKQLDSLALVIGDKNLNYFFVTEMDERSTITFLSRKNATFAKFRSMGGMDDLMSAAYNARPLVWSDGKKRKFKMKPAYFLFDGEGTIIYHSYKYWLPTKDTALVARIKTYSSHRAVKILN